MPRDDLNTIFSQKNENVTQKRAQELRNRANSSQNSAQSQNFAPPVEVKGGLSGNENDFSMSRAQETAMLMKDNIENGEQSPQQAVFRPTNVRYYDEKLKNGTISPYDAYLAKKFLGINVAEYGDVTAGINLNAKVKGLGLTASHDEMYSNVDDGNTFDRYIMSSENNTGFWNGLWRKTHTAFNGLPPTSQGEFIVNEELASKALARTNTGNGRLTNQQVKDAKTITAAGSRNENEFLRQALANKKSMFSRREQNIRNNIAKGVKIPEVVAQSYIQDLNKIAYLENAVKNKNFSYKEYAKYLYDNSAQVGSSGLLDKNTQQNSALRRVEKINEKK